MTWNDIEAKWAAMARRVGSDHSQGDDPIATDLPPDPPEGPSVSTGLRAPAPQESTAS